MDDFPMKAKIAVATVSGKVYYMLVNEMKVRGVPFLSLTPYENIPLNIQVVLTTEAERKHIKHPNVLVFKENSGVSAIVDEAVKQSQGKKDFETLTVGVDPGKTFGIAVLSDNSILETTTCSSIEGTLGMVVAIFNKHQASVRVIKTGNLSPAYTAELLPLLDAALPKDIIMEMVPEAGTSRFSGQSTHKKRLKHTMAAIRIAERRGQIYKRKGVREIR